MLQCILTRLTKLTSAVLIVVGLYWLKVQTWQTAQPTPPGIQPQPSPWIGHTQHALAGRSPQEDAAQATLRHGTVVSVPTADSLLVLADEAPIQIRLCGIDAPELTQPSGQPARTSLQQLLERSHHQVQFIPVRQQAKQLIAEVILLDQSADPSETAILLNQALVQDGFARVYQPYVQECLHQQGLMEAEALARQQQRGLWAKPDLQPWAFRRQQVAQQLRQHPNPVKALASIKPDYLRDGMQQTTVGMASWYGPMLHGRTTANGETFDQNDLTAAHVSLPFNTRLRVTNLENGKSVIVRINDYHPAIDTSTIDLSQAAAQKIGAIEAGVVPVEMEILAGR